MYTIDKILLFYTKSCEGKFSFFLYRRDQVEWLDLRDLETKIVGENNGKTYVMISGSRSTTTYPLFRNYSKWVSNSRVLLTSRRSLTWSITWTEKYSPFIWSIRVAWRLTRYFATATGTRRSIIFAALCGQPYIRDWAIHKCIWTWVKGLGTKLVHAIPASILVARVVA